MSSVHARGKQIEQAESNFGDCGFHVHQKKEEEAKEENMDAVMAREKRPTWHANFANGAWGKYSFMF